MNQEKELLSKGEKTDLFDKIRDKLQEENKKKLVDETALKRAKDWSILSSQVVGAESR